MYQYVSAWGFATATQELLNHIQGMSDIVEQLEKKQRGEVSDKLREGVS